MALIPVAFPRLDIFDASDILLSGVFTNNGRHVADFEEAVSKRLGIKHFIAMANGTLPIEFAVSILSNVGDEVVMPSFTFAAVASAIVRMGRKIRFADIREDNWTIDWSSCTHTNLAVAPNVFGVVPDRCEDSAVIYDNAEGFGSVDGVYGNLDTYSFHATKIVYSGEGGGIATDSDLVARSAREWRNFGFNGIDGDVSMPGTNAKMSEFHALIGIQSLKLEGWQKKCRTDILQRYKSELSGKVIFQSGNPYNCIILVPNREAVVKKLFEAGIDSRRYFFPIHKMTPYKQFCDIPLPVTDRISSMALAIPLWAGLKDESIETICRIILGES